mgnify:CR=1 FL=1|jgi:hypothetical protein
MSETVQMNSSRKATVGALLLWGVTTVLGLLNLVALREVGLATLALAGATLAFAALADKILILLLGIAALAVIILSEAYYRKGAKMGNLIGRFLTVSAWQLLVIAACGMILRWMPGLSEAARTPVWIIAGSLTLCAMACVLRWVSRKTNVQQPMSNAE